MDDEIARIDDPNSLISEPFVDGLARIQQEKYLQKRMVKQKSKKTRDKKLVATYLKSKFPDAFSREMTVPERDFPRLLKLAKRKYIARIVASAMGIPAGIAGLIIGLMQPTELPLGVPLFIAGLAMTIFCIFLTFLSAITLVDGE